MPKGVPLIPRDRKGKNNGSYRHGGSCRTGHLPEYDIYHAARQRCINPNNHCYYLYGGRGIKFLFDSFEQFLMYVGRRPSPKHSLDRIDNDGDYEVTNVRWATAKEQVHNRRVKFLHQFSTQELKEELKRRKREGI